MSVTFPIRPSTYSLIVKANGTGFITASLNVDDLIIHRSDRSGVADISVTIHEFRSHVLSAFMPAREGYSFCYRPRTEKGNTWVTVAELGLHRHHISRNHILIAPPLLTVHSEWECAAGIVVNFSFAPLLFESLAEQLGVFEITLKRPWHDFFSINHRIEALCRLLMEETEDRCYHGPLYFEPLARALAVSVLDTVRDQRREMRSARIVPSRIRRVLQYLESNFVTNLSLAELAAKAQMSRSNFALTFRRVTGHTPHQYLLLVRLNHARKLLLQENSPLSLADIATASGFFDQAHLTQQFRRFFGTTPAAFRSRQGDS
jgi:AraC family transcriptional regulator